MVLAMGNRKVVVLHWNEFQVSMQFHCWGPIYIHIYVCNTNIHLYLYKKNQHVTIYCLQPSVLLGFTISARCWPSVRVGATVHAHTILNNGTGPQVLTVPDTELDIILIIILGFYITRYPWSPLVSIQNGRHFTDDIFKVVFFDYNFGISITQKWFRWWLGTRQATWHWWWSHLLAHKCLNLLTTIMHPLSICNWASCFNYMFFTSNHLFYPGVIKFSFQEQSTTGMVIRKHCRIFGWKTVCRKSSNSYDAF